MSTEDVPQTTLDARDAADAARLAADKARAAADESRIKADEARAAADTARAAADETAVASKKAAEWSVVLDRKPESTEAAGPNAPASPPTLPLKMAPAFRFCQ